MENTASTGDPTTAVSNLWLVYTVAGNCQCGRAYRRLDLGVRLAPADYQQGNSYRIIYLHVPAAIWSMGIYASMAVAAFIGLVWQMKMANLAVAAMAPIGARVYLYCPGYRLCMGKTDVGHLVGMGCTSDF